MGEGIEKQQSDGGKEMTRRDFLRTAGIVAGAVVGGMALSSCGVKTDSPEVTEKPLIERKKYLTEASRGISISPEYLGAVDPRDPNVSYPRALKEDGIMNVGGVNVKITYKGGVFANEDVTFLHCTSEGEKPNVGDILPYAFVFTQKEEKTETGEKIQRRITLDNSAMSLQGSKYQEIPLLNDTTYCAIPMIVAGTGSKIVDNGNTPAKSFEIDSDNLLGTDRGYLSWALLQIGKEQNGDSTLGAQMLGVVRNTDSSGIYLKSDSPEIPKVSVV